MPFANERRASRRETRALEYAFMACVLLFVVVGLAIPQGFIQAQDALTNTVNWLLVIIARFLEWLINFIGQLVLMFVDMIISVAQYNDFVNAKPVEAGWPLVRDVVNMFFIVILLITAFSTIIQYKKFQYKQVLPKLLLMAVLVNFSKTFIGLLIDVSQVIMLTFVNGFQAAAAGNFVTALKLNTVVSLASSGAFSTEVTTGTPTDSLLVQVVMAELLGMFMLGTSLVMLTILLVYLIVRVVGLWIALIMSPAAFFATALESTPLAKGVAFIAGSFWPRLGALLSGGPIMAFFLWLTLATVQTGGFGDFSNTNAVRQEEQQQISYFASRVGNAQEVATFFVAILMLLMGVEAAVSIAGQVSSTLGNVAGQIRTGGMAATRFATYGGALLAGRTAGRLAARGGGAAARAAGRYADARMFQSRGGLTGAAGQLMQRVGTSLAPALGGDVLARRGAQLRGVRGTRRKEEQKRLDETTAEMSAGEKLKMLAARAEVASNPDEKKAIQIQRAKTMTSKEGLDALKEKYQKQGISEKGFEADTPELEAYVDDQMRKETGTHFAELKKLAKDTGDEDIKKYVNEFQEKRPDLLLDDKEFEKDFSSRMDKGVNELTKIPEEAWKDGRLMSALVEDTDGLLETKGGKVVVNEEHEVYKRLMQSGGRSKIMKQQFNDLVAAAGGAAATEAGVKAAAAQGRTMQGRQMYQKTTGQGSSRKWERVNPATSQGPAAKQGRALRRQEDRIAAARTRVDQYREELKGTPANQAGFRVSDMRQAQYDMTTQGGSSIKEAYGLGKDGKLGGDADRQNFRANMEQFVKERGSESVAYRNVDVADLYDNPKGENEARRIYASTADVGKMGEAWHQAEVMGSTDNLKQIQAHVGAVHMEGSRVQERIEAFNRSVPAEQRVNIEQVAQVGMANDPNKLQETTAAMGDKAPSMDEARALANKFQIDSPEGPLQNFRKVETPRAHRKLAEERMRRQRATAGPTGGDRGPTGNDSGSAGSAPSGTGGAGPDTPPASPPPPPPPSSLPPAAGTPPTA